MSKRFARCAGFTLVELMVTVVIVAILSAVAIPSYQGYIKKGRRIDASALLQSAAIAQEKHRLNHATYAGATADLSPPCPSAGPCTSENGNYTLAAPTAVTASTYTLTATATSTSQLADTGCTAIVYAVSGSTITYSPATCWQR